MVTTSESDQAGAFHSKDSSDEESDSSVDFTPMLARYAHLLAVPHCNAAFVAKTSSNNTSEQEEEESEEEVDEDPETVTDESETDHDVTHRKKRADCRGCSSGKASRKRRTKKKKGRTSKSTENFGGKATLDTIVCHKDEKDWGYDQERYAGVFFDRGTDCIEVSPHAKRDHASAVEGIIFCQGAES